jgi:hypothetical protein
MTLSGEATTGGGGQRFLVFYQTGYRSIEFCASPTTSCTAFLPLPLPPGFTGRLPGGQGAGDGRPPSPTLFEVIPGSPDTLRLQSTVNGTPSAEPHFFRRAEYKFD